LEVLAVMDNYFKNHSDVELANLALEYHKFQKVKKGGSGGGNPKYEKDNQFYQEIQSEIVARFIERNKK
jgi:hypothetical protein